MGDRLEFLSENLSNNLLVLRRKQGLSQKQLAEKAGVPRSTLTYMESGESNPSLANLVKVTAALQVTIEELLSAPKANVQLIRSREIPLEYKSKKLVAVEKLLPDPIPGMEIDRMSLEPGSRFKGTPHINQTREYLYCSSGAVRVYVNRSQYNLKAGDLLVFPGDEPHAYENLSQKQKTICFSVVVFAGFG